MSNARHLRIGTLSVAWVLSLAVSSMAHGEVILYGGLGGHGINSGTDASTNDGSLVIVNQTDGSTKVVGHPQGVARISGLAFGLDGTLFGSTQTGTAFPPPNLDAKSDLIRIDPDTGALLSSVPIIDGATQLSVADLAVQPVTGVLYAVGAPGGSKLNGSGRVYTINATTGAATFIGDTGKFYTSIAFAPDGTLYMSSGENIGGSGPLFPLLMTLNPSNAAVQSSIPASDFFHSLAVRPSDGVIFGGTADQQGVYTINPANGIGTKIGVTSAADFVGDLAFRTSAAALNANQHGLTGSWYEATTSGQGVEIEVYPDLAGPGTGLLQGSWFTYDHVAPGGAASQRWYTFSGGVSSTQPSATLGIYQNVGGNFNAPPMTAPVAVGTVTLSFIDCAHATMSYSFTDGSGRSGIIDLQRLTANVTCAPGGSTTNADFAYSGNWFDTRFVGQGIVLEVNPNSPAAFFAWYTYAPNGQAQGAAGQRWYTGLGGYTHGARTLSVDLAETTGGLFDSPNPAPHTVVVGTATITFTSCTTGQLAFNFTGGSSAGASGVINLSRIGPTPAGCL